MRRFATVLALAAAMPAEPVDACTCATAGVQVFPTATETAPLNSHVYLIIPFAAVGGLDKVVFEVRPALSKAEEKKLKKKLKKLKKRRKRDGDDAAAAQGGLGAVEVDRRETSSPALGFVELTPRASLAANTRYQIWMTLPGGKPAVVGELTTGTAADQAAPTWDGISAAVWKSAPATPGTCQTGRPHLLLDHKPAPDDGGDHVLYAVWTGDAQGKIDYAAAPRAFAVDWNGKLALGPASTCVPSNLEVPGTGSLRLGVKAIDRAGNASPPSERTLSAPGPAPAASPRAPTPSTVKGPK